MSDKHLKILETYTTDRAQVLRGIAVASWLPEQYATLANLGNDLDTEQLNLDLDAILKADSTGKSQDLTKRTTKQLQVMHGAAIKRAINMVYGQQVITGNQRRLNNIVTSGPTYYGNAVTIRNLTRQRNAAGVGGNE